MVQCVGLWQGAGAVRVRVVDWLGVQDSMIQATSGVGLGVDVVVYGGSHCFHSSMCMQGG